MEAAPAPFTVLYVDDEPQNLEVFRLQFEGGYRIRTALSASEALAILAREEVAILLSDERMPEMRGVDLLATVLERWPDVVRIIVSAYSDPERLLLAINRGHAMEYVLKPWTFDGLKGCLDRWIDWTARRRALLREAALGASMLEEQRHRRGTARLIGATGGLAETLAVARRAAQSDATVVVKGETGTGKELIAEFVHACSRRSEGPFIRVNCAALAEGVLESELFGHEQGAFTGAQRARRGRFELADGGTLFLDEIGDVSPKLQVSLLRVLQDRSVERVGGAKSIPVDVRVIAATHRDLRAAVREGRFREDLFYRLDVIPLDVPPLRERRGDIADLVGHFMRKHAPAGTRRTLADGVIEAMLAYDWPGNVRELENVVQRALVLGDDDELTVDAFALRLDAPPEPARLPRDEARDVETQRIRSALLRSGGNLARAARMLGIPRTTLASRAAKLGLL